MAMAKHVTLTSSEEASARKFASCSTDYIEVLDIYAHQLENKTCFLYCAGEVRFVMTSSPADR